jgi:hypothetical protein
MLPIPSPPAAVVILGKAFAEEVDFDSYDAPLLGSKSGERPRASTAIPCSLMVLNGISIPPGSASSKRFVWIRSHRGYDARGKG